MEAIQEAVEVIQMRNAGELVQGIEKQLYSVCIQKCEQHFLWAGYTSMMPFKLYTPVNWKGRFARSYIILLYGNLSNH